MSTPNENKMGVSLNEIFEFNDSNRAISIKRFDTPQPWINYLSNGVFHAFVSQAGGGFSWWKSPIVGRLTRYRQYNLPIDSPGFYVYIKHEDGTVWSPTFRPCETPLDKWEARHQPGKTSFHAQKKGIKAELTFFVAPEHDVLIWDLKLENTNNENINLDVFAYAENSQLGWLTEAPYGYYVKLQLKTWFNDKAQAVNYLYHHSDIPNPKESPLCYMASDKSVKSYSGSRNGFLGNYRSEINPIGVERGDCGGDTIDCGEPASALQREISLTKGAEKRLQFFLGVSPGALLDLNKAEELQMETLEALRAEGAIDEQLSKLDAWWNEHFEAYQCKLPDATVERQINTWNVINAVQTGRYSRSVNQVAPGVRGIGFRDSSQDMLAIAYRRPEWAIQVLKQLLAYQYRDGHVVHLAVPETKGLPGTSKHSDDHLWPPLVTYAILSETGDYSLLDEKVSYLAEDHVGKDGAGTIWEHLISAIKYTEANLGKHELPLTMASDWNDIIGRFNKRGEGESVFAGQQYALALKQLSEIAWEADKTEYDWLCNCHERIENALVKSSWDGAWWCRGFDDDGNAVGSKSCEAGKIFLNPQSWAVISGIGLNEQQNTAMNSVAENLDANIGLTLLAPSFTSWEIGETKAKVGYGPGCGENGAIFCHANTWAIMAEAILGNAERAWKYFTQLIPVNAMKKIGIECYKAEPYAWVSNIVGPENKHFGWANVEQITGTAPWMDVVSTQYLLGVRATLSGLIIDPCIPKEWSEFTVYRLYRGCSLTIHIKNPDSISKGVGKLVVDSEEIICDKFALIKPEYIAGKKTSQILVVLK